jgi:uncharacterized protein YecE (DUF72 family)
MASLPLCIGTAGWSVSSRYASDIPLGGSHLERYARCLNAVEINSSFYRPHQFKTYERWAGSTPADFRFAAKVPKAITHEQRLVDCQALLDHFVEEISGLGDKLGGLLVQLPPTLVLEKRFAGRFFRDLRKRVDVPVACEPRHASWFASDAGDWLAKYGVARVAVDPASVEGAGEPGGYSGLAYYRWHGSPRVYYSDYDGVALKALETRLIASRRSRVPTWCIFDNTAEGAALGNALTLQRALSRRAVSISAG